MLRRERILTVDLSGSSLKSAFNWSNDILEQSPSCMIATSFSFGILNCLRNILTFRLVFGSSRLTMEDLEDSPFASSVSPFLRFSITGRENSSSISIALMLRRESVPSRGLMTLSQIVPVLTACCLVTFCQFSFFICFVGLYERVMSNCELILAGREWL